MGNLCRASCGVQYRDPETAATLTEVTHAVTSDLEQEEFYYYRKSGKSSELEEKIASLM